MTIFDWYTSFIRLRGICIVTFFLLWYTICSVDSTINVYHLYTKKASYQHIYQSNFKHRSYTIYCFSVKSDQTILVIFGHFCETKSFPFIKLVYVYQIFAYTNHIPNKIILKSIRDHLLNLNYFSPYITIVFPSKINSKNQEFIILSY